MASKMRNKDLAKLAYTYRATASTTDVAILNFLQALNTPRALTVWILYSTGEHAQLVNLEVLPLHYKDGKAFRDDYMATCFLSKANFLKLDVSRKEAAMTKFFKFEEQCRQTNNRFRNLLLDPSYNGANATLLDATRRKIKMILDVYAPDEFVDSANWGPGVTTLLKGQCVSAFNKFQEESGITRDLYSLVDPWFATAYPLWAQHLQSKELSEESGMFTFQRGNTIVTVPKNSKTDRVIAIEPGINLWFQKAIGSMIRRRLLRFGVNLNSQDWNQLQAKRSANHGLLATVDFSSASDSISRSVVQELLPARWFQLLDATRSKLGIDGAQVLRWNKFSSMGNGFTFELESLIFFAAALAVCEECREETHDVSVFGDDVILPTRCFKLFASFCDFLGFTVNYQKSFFDGYFRESCGAHYFAGLDCKPVYLKERLHNVQSVYKLANSVRLAAHRYHFNGSCDQRFRRTWTHLVRGVPKHFQCFVPHGIGDCGFIGNFDEATPAVAGRGFEGYHVSGLIEVGVTRPCDGAGLLLAGVRFGSDREYGNTFTLRGRTRIQVARILVPQWYNLGGWV